MNISESILEYEPIQQKRGPTSGLICGVLSLAIASLPFIAFPINSLLLLLIGVVFTPWLGLTLGVIGVVRAPHQSFITATGAIGAIGAILNGGLLALAMFIFVL